MAGSVQGFVVVTDQKECGKEEQQRGVYTVLSVKTEVKDKKKYTVLEVRWVGIQDVAENADIQVVGVKKDLGSSDAAIESESVMSAELGQAADFENFNIPVP